MNTLGKTAVTEQADSISNFGLYSLIPFAVGMIVMGLIWFVYRRKSSATIKTLNTELTKSQSSLNALSASYDDLEKDASEDRRLRTVAEERLAESEEARKADSDAAQTMISELRDSPRIDDKAAAIAKKTIEGLEAENGKLAAKLEAAEKVKPALPESADDEGINNRHLRAWSQWTSLKPYLKQIKKQVNPRIAEYNRDVKAFQKDPKSVGKWKNRTTEMFTITPLK